MHQIPRRLLSFALILILVCSLSVPAFAADSTVTPVTGTSTVYLTSPTGQTSYVSVQIASGTKSFSIKRANVTVTAGTTDAEFTGLYKNYNGSLSEYKSGSSWTSYSYANYTYSVRLKLTKPGTATVKYVIDGTTYTLKVKVLAYTNPVSLVKITATDYRASIATFTKTSNYASRSLTISKNLPLAQVAVTPVSGWRIRYVELYDQAAGTYREISNYSNGLSKVNLSLGQLNAGRNYTLYVDLFNTSNNATMNLTYRLVSA